MKSSLRRTVFVVLILAALGALLYRMRGVIGLEGFSWARLGEVLRHTRFSWLLAAVGVIYVVYALRAARWARFSRYLGSPSFSGVYSCTLIGFTALFLLGRAAEPIRPLIIARKERLSVPGTFGIYVLERVFDLASTVTIAGLALLIFSPARLRGTSPALLTMARTAGLAMFAGLLAMIGFLLYFRFHGAGALARRLEGWRARPGWHARAAGLFEGFSGGLQAIRTLADLLAAVGLSAAHWAGVVVVYLCVTHGFGGRLAELDVGGALLVLAFSMVGSTMQLPGVGGGMQVATFLAFTTIFGVEKEAAAACSIVLWLVTFAGSSLAGVPLLIREGWSMGELRRLAQAEAEAEAVGTHISLPSGGSSGEARP